MSFRDYIHCQECDCKLIYDGEDSIRNAFESLWGDKQPTLLCLECSAKHKPAFPAEASGEADSKAIHWAIRCLQAAGEQSHSELLREYAKDVCVLLSSRSAEKTVPMELVERLRHQGIHTREWIVELFAKFGYTVTEGKEDGR